MAGAQPPLTLLGCGTKIGSDALCFHVQEAALDFEPTYSEEQERFRQEVRAWMRDNVPDDLERPADSVLVR